MNQEKKTDWTALLVTSIVFLFCTSLILYVMADRRREDAEYFKGRLAALETRMNNSDKRAETFDRSLSEINQSLRDVSVLTVQINQHVLENSRQLENIIRPPKPLTKKGQPKSAFKPERLSAEPVIQGPRPEPPVRGPGIPRTGGKPTVD